MEPKPFDELTLEDFEAYEDIRTEGLYNMYGPRARQETGLDGATYHGVMRHYSALAEKWPAVRA